MENNPYNLPESVALLTNYLPRGDIIEDRWFSDSSPIKFKNGKPHLNAMLILANLIYWHRPTLDRDETTDREIGYRKKFKADLLQKSYSQLEERYGFSKKQIKDAVVFLEELGLLQRVFRTVETRIAINNNVMYIDLNSKKLLEINELCDSTLLPSREPPPSLHRSTERGISTEGPPYIHVETYTKTTTKNLREVAFEKSSPPPTRSEVVLEKKGRGSRLSPTWELPEEYREWAVKRGLFNEQIDNQAERFRDHWISTTKNAVKLDWAATWRNWLNNARDVKLTNPISPIKIEPPKPTIKNSSDPKIQKWYDSRGEGLDLKYGSGVWKSWFEPLVLVSFTKDEAVFKAPTRWIATEIKRRFIDGIFQSLKRIDPEFGISSASVRHPEENAIRITYNE